MKVTLRFDGHFHKSTFISTIFMLTIITLNQAVAFSMSTSNAINDNSDSGVDQRQVLVNLYQDSCPPWFYFDQEMENCRCLPFYAARCFDNKAYLFAGYCATYDEDTEIISLATCPYHGYTTSLHDRHWYTQLPDNLSELNHKMCGPLNRKGRVCSECKDGFGLAATSVGLQYFECSDCSGAWYGIPLFLFLELLPLTVFYLVILLFQINITSGSITCFIMYCQLVVMAFDRVFAGDDPRISHILHVIDNQDKWLVTVTITIYDVWNLRFFRNLMPSFCINSHLKAIHLSFLSYISVFYPLFLIFLTWACVEFYDRKYRLFVWIWKPFKRALKGKQYTVDFVNVFASFFLLSFTKVIYQAVLLLIQRTIKDKKVVDINYNYFVGHTYVVGADQSVTYGSTEHLLFLIPAAILCLILCILPAVFLTLYPLRPFRALFSRCKLDGIVINTFVEKFYGCYRNGLDGGRDMRGFAGLYFFTRLFLFLSNIIADVLHVSHNDPYFVKNIILVISALLIALCRPYKETYMNIVDTLILAHFGLLCHLVSSEGSFSSQRNLAITVEVMLALPLFCYLLFHIAKASKFQEISKKAMTCSMGALEKVYQNCKSHCRINNTQKLLSTVDRESQSDFMQQILAVPLSIENTYGTINEAAYP